jgi:O-antigen/teichoic acid export membrane protein
MTVSDLLRRTRALSRGGLGNLLVAQVVSVASSVAVTFATAFFMGPEQRGDVAYVLSLGNLLGVFAFGSYHVGAVHAERRGERLGRRTGLRAAVASASVILVCGMLLATAAWAAGSDLALSTALAAVGGTFVAINFFALRLGQALGHDAEFRNAWLIQGLGFAIGGSLLAATVREPVSVLGAWIFCLVASTAYILRAIDWVGPRGDQPAAARRVIVESWSAHVATLGVQVLYRFNVVALGLFATRTEVGLFSVAAPIAECTWLISEAVSLLAFRHAIRDGGASQRLASVHFVMTVLGGCVVAVAAWVLLPIALPKFADARVLVLVLLPGVLVQGAARVALGSMLGREPSRRAIMIGIASAAAAAAYVPAAMAGGAMAVAVVSSILYCLLGAAVITADRLDVRHRTETA